MKLLKASEPRLKLSIVSRNRKYHWLLLSAFCCRTVGMGQRSVSGMQLHFNIGTPGIGRWAGAHAEGYRD